MKLQGKEVSYTRQNAPETFLRKKVTMCLPCSGFSHLDGMSKRRLIDSLCSNLSVLGVSVNSLVSVDDEEERDEAVTSHCSALKAYTFLLWWIHTQAEQEAADAAPANAAARQALDLK